MTPSIRFFSGLACLGTVFIVDATGLAISRAQAGCCVPGIPSDPPAVYVEGDPHNLNFTNWG